MNWHSTVFQWMEELLYKLEYVRKAGDIRLVMLEQLTSPLSVFSMISFRLTELTNINEKKRLYSHFNFKSDLKSCNVTPTFSSKKIRKFDNSNEAH